MMKSMHETHNTQQPAIPGYLIFMLALTAGMAVASLYYCQPLLALLGNDFHLNSATVGTLPTLTQAGYALGLMLLIPLGDKFDRRRVILVKGLALAAALAFTAVSPGLALLLVASFIVGITATMAQDVIPTAAAMTDSRQRGRVVGQVMTGLLTGILLSRVFSGFIGEWFGWRSVYLAAAAAMLLVTILLWRALPRFTPASTLSVGQLYRSMFSLLATHAKLQKAAVAQGLLNAAFSAFWSTLALMLYQNFHLGSSAAGLFGLAGAVGALTAPFFGKAADRFGPQRMTRIGALLTGVSFLLMLFAGSAINTTWYLPILAVLTVSFDMGVQMCLISHQTIIYNTAPHAMSRANAILLAGVFIGMTSGSLVASQLFSHWGWQAVIAFATLVSTLALLLRLLPERRTMISDSVI
ncbi:putative MFS family arabinose efflux permease [Shewanella fodinae]|uniref:Putative MFS family arabinose efflux permease n=2 Tax=Shewanella fodinae TaxID=552357 RepID=A0A4R2FGU9_9GAMM|nr:putative MFS family arabinose efflux permease [Shewanella fodinae]